MGTPRPATPERNPSLVEMEILYKKGHTTICECGKQIHKYWHVKTGPKGNSSYPEMKKCAPCYFNG